MPFDESLLNVDTGRNTVILTSRGRAGTGQVSPVYSGRVDDPGSYKIANHHADPVRVIGNQIFVAARGDNLYLVARTEVGWMNIAQAKEVRPWRREEVNWMNVAPKRVRREPGRWTFFMVVHKSQIPGAGLPSSHVPETAVVRPQCAICLERLPMPFAPAHVMILPCAHAFHLECYEPAFRSGQRNCPSCQGYSHVACACGRCELAWQLEKWVCPQFVPFGRCDFVYNGEEHCPWGCPSETENELCPHILDYLQGRRPRRRP